MLAMAYWNGLFDIALLCFALGLLLVCFALLCNALALLLHCFAVLCFASLLLTAATMCLWTRTVRLTFFFVLA